MAKKLERQTEKVQDLEKRLKRALADYANLQKRVEAERERIIKFSEAALLTKFLSVLDTLESAEETAKQEGSVAVGQGLALTIDQFRKILKEEGVEEIKTNGHFDPQAHEAVDIVKGKVDNKIVEVIEKGFRIEDKILRPAKVKVAKKQIEETSSQAQKEIKSGDYV